MVAFVRPEWSLVLRKPGAGLWAARSEERAAGIGPLVVHFWPSPCLGAELAVQCRATASSGPQVPQVRYAYLLVGAATTWFGTGAAPACDVPHDRCNSPG